MRELRDAVQRAARSSDTAVLVTGESGAGKDTVARAIHEESARANRPFVHVLCSTLSEDRFELELFGSEGDGPQTPRHPGMIDGADGGTLFVDGVLDLSSALQGKLLRFLENGTLRQAGATTDHRIDLRIVASACGQWDELLESETVRKELLHRLAVLVVHVPPLRERRGDIRLLVDHWLRERADHGRRGPQSVTPAALAMLEAHTWPGNVRELANALERAVIAAEHDILDVSDFRLLSPRRVENGQKNHFELPAEGIDFRELERNLIVQALQRASGNQTRAAQLLGMTRDQIRYRMAKFGLDELRPNRRAG
jgi:DNA-binding NtrC family response regulator